MKIDRWFVFKYAGLGISFASFFNIESHGVNIYNASVAFLGFCLVLSGVIQDVKRNRMLER